MNLAYPLSSDLLTYYISLTQAFKTVLTSQCGINVLQYRLLLCLLKHSGQQKSRKISDELSVSPPSITSATTHLEQKGFVKRLDDENDRRTVYVSITPQGEMLMEKVHVLLSDLISDWLEPCDEEAKRVHLDGGIVMLRALERPLYMVEGQVVENTAYIESILECYSVFAHALEGTTLKQNEFRVLFELFEHPRGIRAGQLSKTLFIKLTEITQICDSLAKHNLVFRSRDTADRRSTRIEITSDGYALLDKIAPLVDSAFASSVYEVSDKLREAFTSSATKALNKQRERNRNTL